MRRGLKGGAVLEAAGVPGTRYPRITGDYDLNYTNIAEAQYAWLRGIEQGTLKRTGKRAEFELCQDEAAHPRMIQLQHFDGRTR